MNKATGLERTVPLLAFFKFPRTGTGLLVLAMLAVRSPAPAAAEPLAVHSILSAGVTVLASTDSMTFSFGDYYHTIEIFDSFQLTTNDVGRLFPVTQAEDPDFNSLVSILTNGRSDNVGYDIRFGPGGSGTHAGEQLFFSLPTDQIDFQGFAINNISLLVEELSISHPDSARTSVFFRGKIYVNSRPWPPPAILMPPQTQTAEIGSPVQFCVRASAFPTAAYQWFFNGTNALGDCTNECAAIADVQPADCGAYTVVVTNMFGTVTSAPAMLSVIPRVEHRPVPALSLRGDPGASLNIQSCEGLGSPLDWRPLDTVSLVNTSQFYLDLSMPLPSQRFYRVWQTGSPGAKPSLDVQIVPAITLTGNIGDSVRVDAINQFGPIDAWFALDTVTLTNTSQLYFDTSAWQQPPRLYRLTPVP